MTPTKTFRAAVDRLDALDRAATPGPWLIEEKHGRDITDEGWSYFGILIPREGARPREIACMTVDDSLGEERPRPDADLIVALRPAAGHLAQQFRYAAEFVEAHYPGEDFPESALPTWVLTVLPVARAVLGESS